MTTLGVLVANSDMYPTDLSERGRKTILSVLEKEGFKTVALGPKDTKCGSVSGLAEARKCADLFRSRRDAIDGIIVTLPNHGSERAAADALRMSGLDTPVLIHAFPDEPGRMGIEKRGDGFCGKISLCNALSQYGIPYSLTAIHAVDPESDAFSEDLAAFAGVCRIVRGLRGARFGQVGTRPATSLAARYSETLLERAGITVEAVDLSELLGRAWGLRDKESAVVSKLDEIKGYVKTTKIPRESLIKMSKLAVALEQLISERELSGTAVQCWTSMQENFGVAPCAVMSMLGSALHPSACEADVMGLIAMKAMVLASGKPSAMVNWSNNYGEDPDKGVIYHCGSLPQEMLGKKGAMDYHEHIAGTLGKEKTYGTIVGRIKPTEITYCHVLANEGARGVLSYIGEGEITKDPIATFGSYGVVKIPGFQGLLRRICRAGFSHHVAINPSRVAAVIEEAFSRYLAWEVDNHGVRSDGALQEGAKARGAATETFRPRGGASAEGSRAARAR
jgi:L-fucose isomerase-like protein